MSEAADWHATVPAAAVEPGMPVRARAGGHRIVLYAVEHSYFATAELCTHGQASLADGYQDGYRIECPLHQGLFDVRTGEAVGAPCTVPVRSYPVRVSEGILMVAVPTDKPPA
jgi:naphthalene 1,2-dioxygenase ferredoxin component